MLISDYENGQLKWLPKQLRMDSLARVRLIPHVVINRAIRPYADGPWIDQQTIPSYTIFWSSATRQTDCTTKQKDKEHVITGHVILEWLMWCESSTEEISSNGLNPLGYHNVSNLLEDFLALLNPQWARQNRCHLNLGNLIDVQERHITNRNWFWENPVTPEAAILGLGAISKLLVLKETKQLMGKSNSEIIRILKRPNLTRHELDYLQGQAAGKHLDVKPPRPNTNNYCYPPDNCKS
ncbi:hypothetical protein J6590_047983 [Homalodisca vitripennis]|nr:hypothetical protein J6590_090454 [Homalodisca vitripennis]KAG8292083.1 hypothetical protein J6590_047983 [Homalodisca vitripennis]